LDILQKVMMPIVSTAMYKLISC